MTSYREMAVRSFGWLAAFQVASPDALTERRELGGIPLVGANLDHALRGLRRPTDFVDERGEIPDGAKRVTVDLSRLLVITPTISL